MQSDLSDAEDSRRTARQMAQPREHEIPCPGGRARVAQQYVVEYVPADRGNGRGLRGCGGDGTGSGDDEGAFANQRPRT